MKKRVACFMLAALMAIMVFPLGDITAYAVAKEYPVKGGSVYFDPQTGLITGYSGSVTEATIPEKIYGEKVLGIGDDAFASCYSLTDVVLPEGIQTIGSGAFNYCDNLKSINLPKTVVEIGAGAFYFCRGLESIAIPEGVKIVSAWAFGHCHGLQSITIPKGVTTIEESAFFSCESLTEVVIPEGVTTIGNAAFSWCRFMTEVTIPAGVITIGDHAFSYCYSLKGVVIPDGVTTLGSSAFSYGYDLTSVTMPDSVTFIGETAFEYCGSGMNLYYGGTEEQWAAISKVNNDFSGVTLHFDNTCEHNYEAVVTEPNCTEEGFTTYTCSLCGDTYVDAPAEALGHAWDDGKVTMEPTEENEGVCTFTCTRCGEERTETIPPRDHVHDYTAVITEPTCTEAGFTTCTCACGDSYLSDETAALGHDYNETITAPTCKEGGFTTCICTRCGDIDTGDETAALGHVWDEGKVTTESTEESEGIRTFTCTRCGEERTETIPPKDHVHSYTAVITEPTCTEVGFATCICACGDSYLWDETAALGHDYDETITAPTCTEGGFTTCICTRCGNIETGDETAVLGHAWDDGKVTEEPTEEKEGVRTFACTRCGEERTETIPPKDHVHDYKAVITNPTCTEQGYTTHTCACGESYMDAYTDALRHSYTDGLCTRCGAADPDYEKPGHICPSTKFTDVPVYGNWAHDGIDYCVEHELMNGTGNGLFDPNGTVSRAQLVTILYRVAGSPETEFKGTFTDVPSGKWYSKAIEWAAANGVVNGIGNGKFGPDQSITREQIATILYRYEKEPAVSGNLSSFPDHKTVSGFAENGLIWATNEKLINGISSGGVTTLSPQNNATRAQIASVVMRYLSKQ